MDARPNSPSDRTTAATCVNRPGASFIRLRNYSLLKLAFGHVGAGERECHPLDIDGHRQGRPGGSMAIFSAVLFISTEMSHLLQE
jgi:hypothetical protein